MAQRRDLLDACGAESPGERTGEAATAHDALVAAHEERIGPAGRRRGPGVLHPLRHVAAEVEDLLRRHVARRAAGDTRRLPLGRTLRDTPRAHRVAGRLAVTPRAAPP